MYVRRITHRFPKAEFELRLKLRLSGGVGRQHRLAGCIRCTLGQLLQSKRMTRLSRSGRPIRTANSVETITYRYTINIIIELVLRVRLALVDLELRIDAGVAKLALPGAIAPGSRSPSRFARSIISSTNAPFPWFLRPSSVVPGCRP